MLTPCFAPPTTPQEYDTEYLKRLFMGLYMIVMSLAGAILYFWFYLRVPIEAKLIDGGIGRTGTSKKIT